MIEGQPIDGQEERRGPGRPRKDAGRPDIPHAASEAIRPDIRVDSVREAEEYARKLLADQPAMLDYNDEFYVDPSIIPEGWSYEWKRIFVAGKEDPFYMNDLLHKGWREVPRDRHPELMPRGWAGATIEKKGMRLMELPTILTDRMKRKQLDEAKSVLRNSDKMLNETPANTAPRDEFPEKMKKTRRDWSPAIPVTAE